MAAGARISRQGERGERALASLRQLAAELDDRFQRPRRLNMVAREPRQVSARLAGRQLQGALQLVAAVERIAHPRILRPLGESDWRGRQSCEMMGHATAADYPASAGWRMRMVFLP